VVLVSGMVILCASAGLGTYTPAVQFYRYLCAQGRHVSIEVLECLFPPEKLSQIQAARQRFQNDYRFALASRRALRLQSPADSVDPDKRSVLLNRWRHDQQSRFIVFSGFWLPLLKEYQESLGTEIAVDCVQMEVVLSPSWRAHLKDYPFPTRVIWLYSASQGSVLQTLLPAASAAPTRRSRRLVVHGGGWQLGNYDSSLPALVGAGYSLLVGRSQDQPCVSLPNVQYFRVRSRWETWTAQPGDYPPAELYGGGVFSPPEDAGSHWLLQQIMSSSGVVSKPGGATLLDSLAAGSPLIFTSPYGETEAQNARLWCSLGLGMTLVDWERSDYSEELLGQAQERLANARAALPSYAEMLHAA
jgi:hypothetical protein